MSRFAGLRSHAAWREKQRQERLAQKEAERVRAHERSLQKAEIEAQQQQMIMGANLQSLLGAEQAFSANRDRVHQSAKDTRKRRLSRLDARSDAEFGMGLQKSMAGYNFRNDRSKQILTHGLDQSDAAQKFGFDTRLAGQEIAGNKTLTEMEAENRLAVQKMSERGANKRSRFSRDASMYGADRQLEGTQYGADINRQIGADRNQSLEDIQKLTGESYGNVADTEAQNRLDVLNLSALLQSVNPNDPAALAKVRELDHFMRGIQKKKLGIQTAFENGMITKREKEKQSRGLEAAEDALYDQLSLFQQDRPAPPGLAETQVEGLYLGPDGKVFDARQRAAEAKDPVATSPIEGLPLEKYDAMIRSHMTDGVRNAEDTDWVVKPVTYEEAKKRVDASYGVPPTIDPATVGYPPAPAPQWIPRPPESFRQPTSNPGIPNTPRQVPPPPPQEAPQGPFGQLDPAIQSQAAASVQQELQADPILSKVATLPGGQQLVAQWAALEQEFRVSELTGVPLQNRGEYGAAKMDQLEQLTKQIQTLVNQPTGPRPPMMPRPSVVGRFN